MLSKKAFEAEKTNQLSKNNLYTNCPNTSKSNQKRSPEFSVKLLVLHWWDL